MKYELSDTCLTIFDSYQITKKKEMEKTLNDIREISKDRSYDVLAHRSNSNLIKEWASHNLLYDFKYQIHRTKDVDLEYPQQLKYKIGYWILGTIYQIFH